MKIHGRVADRVWLCVLLVMMVAMPGDVPLARTDEPAAEETRRRPRVDRKDAPEAISPISEDARIVNAAERADAIARARVWRQPPVPIRQAYLGGDQKSSTPFDCKFELNDLNGTTPKFDCITSRGERLRIKYGAGGEIPAEAAATRLLTALGFGADSVALVERVRCYGCPKVPFVTSKVASATSTEPLLERVLDAGEYEEFEWVAVERKFPARPIETSDQKGWTFFELNAAGASKEGSPRAHVDALRLLAVFLSHWDNKSENQRLVCLSSNWPKLTPCDEPFLMLQDVGATFGPRKVDLPDWTRAIIWEDRAACIVSMSGLPYDGATFGRARISEAGRQFLAKLLAELTDAQITDLFAGARFDKPRSLFRAAYPVSQWVRAFKARVRVIADGPACPRV